MLIIGLDEGLRLGVGVEAVGGKALGLMRLIAGGLRVPAGFCVTTEAFRVGLGEMLTQLPSLVGVEGALENVALPGCVAEPILAAYRAMNGGVVGGCAVAVRSSAVDEDSGERSFAGQQVTVLGARSEGEVLEAIRRVWLGAFQARAHLYRHNRPLTETPPVPAVAVIVQRLVEADAAGVLFTVNPIDADPHTSVICAAFGLGEAVVEGDDADTFWIRRHDGALLRTQTRTHGQACLEAAQIKALWEVGGRIERLFGGPQDVEFAWEGGALWMLQARPVTAAGRKSVGVGAVRVYTNANVGEALPGVGTPMTWSLIRSFARKGFDAAFGALGLEVPSHYGLFASYRGRIYLNLSEFLSVASQIPLLTRDTLLKISGAEDSSVLRAQEAAMKMGPWKFLQKLPWTAPKALLSQTLMPLVGNKWLKQFGEARKQFYQKDLGSMDSPQLLEVLDWLEKQFERTGEVMLGCSSNFMVSYVVVTEALRRLGGPQSAALEATLLGGLTDVQSAAPGLELLDLARFLRAHPALRNAFEAHALNQTQWANETKASAEGQQFWRMFNTLIERWGHRAAREADLMTPRWNEDHSFLVEVIRQHLKATHLPSAQEIYGETKRRRLEATQLIRAHFLTGTGVVFRGLLG